MMMLLLHLVEIVDYDDSGWWLVTKIVAENRGGKLESWETSR
jgi:hypothetical protein